VTAADFKVSVVITSYNHRDYLDEAIRSVMAQTLRPHEILVADDHSTDGSVELIRGYMERHPGWIKGVFQPSNAGIPRNRNAALREATGNFVGILDGDDLFEPGKLAWQLEALQRVPGAAVAYGNLERIDPQGRALGLHFLEPQPEGDILAEVAELKFGLLRTLVADAGEVRRAGLLDERFPKFDGYWLSVQLAASCRFAYTHEVMVRKRVHPSAESKFSKRKDKLSDLEGILRELQPLLARLDQPRARRIRRAWERHLHNIRTDFKREGGRRIRGALVGLRWWMRGLLTWREVWERVRR
jgi:glycosyltransferase involved in cell wall biosynthesis